MTLETSQGNYPDMEIVAEKTNALRNSLDQILVGLVEARVTKEAA